ncbi:uncharacterized protein [Chelonus insularis]|uniref:uncharacterized protein n=1 Tax=Chelonus insularis TaxID=460826 RepID=UPI00158A660D|nr:uncharacterized protein LOC118075047 [Chelonus insularis]
MSAREVTLVGGSPWGFRMHGGHDLHQPLRISRVNPGSKAAQQGVREGDLISSINGRNTSDLTNVEAHTLLRNAGDQLKLGLNQESVGSPKRRIYKSSLQENTSIETLQKTTKTTTTATRIISSETKRNGTDDTRSEHDFTNQNGTLKTSEYSEKCSQNQETTKTRQAPTECLQLHVNPNDSLDCTNKSAMPHSSRARKTRRNRNKRVKYRQVNTRSDDYSQQPNTNEKNNDSCEIKCDQHPLLETVTKDPEAEKVNESTKEVESIDESISRTIREVAGNLVEAKVNSHAVKVASEVEPLSSTTIRSISGNHVSTRNKQKLERRLVNSEVKICEISSVSGSPLTASIGHMTGVGILQTKLINQEHQHDSIVTISEPVEPLKPLPTDVVLRVETLGKSTALGFSPASEKINKDGPEIHEVTDSDVETTEFCKPSLVVEVDNERESAEHEIKDAILEETSTDNSVDEGNEESICEEDNNEENSVEIASNELSNDEITMQNNDQMIEDGLIKMCGDGGGTKNMIKVKNDKIKDIVKNENFQSREVLLDKKNVSKPLTFIDERRDLQDFEENNLLNNPNIRENEEKSNDNILQCKSKSKSILNNYFSSAGERFLDIIHEESERLSGDEEQHIRDFINGEIAKFRREKRSLNERREEREEEEEEEEKDEKERTIEVSTSRSEDLQVLHETEKNFLVNENAKLQGEISNNTEKKLISNNGKFYSSNSFESFELKSKEKKILDLADNARQVPEPPRRSSSFINKDVVEPIRPPTPLQVDDSPPPLPSPPSLSQYTCLTPFNRVNQFAEDKSGDKPKNPSLPSFLSSSNYTADTPLNLGITHEIELKREEGDRESIKRGTQDLCNNTDESNKIGNDDVDETSRLEIAHDHVDLSATMSWKISDAGHLSACESPRELSSSLKSAAATTVEYRRETKNQDEVESSRPFQVPKVVAEKQKVIGKSLLETRKLECAYKKKYEQNPKNPSFKVENEIKEFPERRELGSSEVLKVVESENIEKLQEKYIDNNLCHEKFLETVEQKIDKCHEEKIINVSLDREVKVKNNNESELNESQEVADNLERCKNSVESVSTDFSLKNIDERGQESSSSAASPSTVRYVPEDTCDIDLVEADVADEESLPKLKLKLSENLNNISETSSSPQPIPYSPVEELYYVPLNENDLVGIEKKNSDIKPSLLKDLCIKKILSMPYGAQIIREITLPKFNIFQNLKTIQKTLENFQSTSEEEVNSSNEMMKKRPKSWMGVPTNQDPQLLVCFSPSQQQENCVRTSADKLLDLHKKFLNRRSYHEQVGVDGRCEIKVPKYRVEVNSTKESQDLEKSERNEWNQSNRVTATSSASSSNRLLEIIKENPIAADDSLPKVTETHKNVRQDRLKTTRLADWLTLARSESPSAGYSKCEKISSSHLSTERRRYGNEVHQNNPLSPIKHPDTLMTDNKATNKCIFNDRSGSSGRGLNDTSHRINSALIIQSPECPNERQNATPLNKTPITQKSAIIDKSSSTPEQRKWRPQPLRGSIDSRHVNPALINDKPETPPRCRRSVTVDRSCIDNTSIFDKAPPKNYLEPRGYGNPEALKQVTAKEIVENLKRLKVQGKDVKDQIDVQRRHSLPPEIFDRQLEYIERLEDQLKEVILAEEEEEKAFKEFHDQVKAEIVLNENKNHSSVSENDDDSREIWHEESRLEDGDHIKYFKKEGHQEKKTSVVEEDGRQIEKSIRVFENKEVNQMSSRKENTDGEVGLEWKRFFEDGAFPEKMQDTPQKFHDNKMKKRPKSISIFPMSDEVFRCKMYDEYIDKVLEREERKHQKVIKISSHVDLNKSSGKNSNSSMNPIEKEFIEKAKNRMNRFGINLDDSETEVVEKNTETIVTETETNITKSESHEERVKCLIDGKEIKDARQLPKHLQEFLVLAATDIGDGYGIATGEKTNEADLLHEIDTALKISQGFLLNQENMLAPKFKASSVKPGVWSPGSEPPPPPKQPSPERGKNTEKDAGIPPVWTPSSAGASPVAERKEFRPVSFESPILRRKNPESTKNEVPSPPWKSEQGEEKKNETSSDITHNISTRIVNSHSVPSQGLNTLASTPRLPRAQNPTITLLQKAREGQLPKGAAYLNESINSQKSLDSTTISADEIIHTVRREYESKPKIESDSSKKMADQGPRKIEGIGPITKNGMPVSLRSEVKDVNQAKWYKQMYDSLHRSRKNDDYVTIRYKSCRGNRYGHGNSGYLSEPDQPRTCIDKSATLDSRRRQRNKENDSAISTIPRKNTVVKTTAEVYRNQPGRIEDYQPGRSTIGEKETKEWWDEVMDIFDGVNEQWLYEQNMLMLGEKAEDRQSHHRHPMALRTFIPTHQLVRTNYNVQTTSSTQSLHPKSSLRTTRAVLEHVDPDAIEVFGALTREDRQPSAASVNLLLGRLKSNISSERVFNSLLKSPKAERSTTTRNRRHARDSKTASREIRNDDAIVVGFIDETIQPEPTDLIQWHPNMLEERSKSFILPNNSSPTSRRSPLTGNRPSPSNKERSFLLMTSPRNHHRNHHHNQRQHHDPSISSSTSSSSSSTIHITMLPPPPPITTTVTAETALTSPSRPFDQRNPYTAKPYMSHALKESGYESDSTLIFRRRDDVSPLSPLEQRLAYKSVQKGGDVPLHGLRKPAPERPKDDTEIQYFPISSTLTRIRVRRKSALTSTSGSMTSTSMTLTRSKKLTPTASSIIPLSRANIIGTFSHAKTPPSPPRRQSSRFNATLKLYTTTGYPQTSNRRHQQCFAAESVSNIRFLRERLSNKLLKHEQGRECGIARKSLTSLRSTPINSAPSTKVKLSGKAITGVVKRKSDPCLAKRSPECIKSVNTVSRDVPAQRIIQTKQSSEKSSEKFLSRIPESSSVTNRQEVRSKTLPSYQKKDQIKIRKPKKEIEETSKRGSSLDSSSFVQVERLSNNRQADVESTLTGSVIKPSSSSLRRVKSQDIGLSKVISKSREIQKTSRAIRSESPAPVIPKCSTTESNKHKSFAAKLTEKLSINTLSVSTGSNSNNRRKSRDKPQTIVKLSVKKPDIDCKSKEMKTDKKRASVKREKTREVIKMKKNEKSDLEKKKDKKSERMIENSLKKTDKNDQSSTAIDRIKKHQQATRTDNFFQNLFLRNTPSPVLSHCSTPRRSSVMERARMFQELGNAGSKSEPSLRSLSVYLTTKRPVSNSRFKNWEQESFSSRSSSPFRVSWPGRSIFQKITKFDSLQRVSDFGSSSGLSRGRSPDYDNCSIIKERSLSEPPIKVSITDERITRITHLPPRSPSPSPTRSSTSLKTSRSWRNNEEDYYSKARARSVSEVENNERRRITFGSNLSLTKSTSSLESPPTSREEYQRYVLEMLHTKKKSKRYKDLHDFYASLERMGKLEKTTSSSDLRPRMKNEDIIDYNRWREVRNKERAEQELKDLYSKLKTVQREKDFLFSTKDIEMFRWKGDYSLRCKERSVENIRETFRRLENEKNEVESTRRHEIASQKDIYKPLWRGNSVVNVASTIMKKANESKQDEHDKWSTEPYLQKTLGGSKKFWSSLSVEQVNALKNQLNEIYGSENERPKVPAKSPNITEKIAVSETPTKFTSKIKNTDSKTEYEVIVPPSEFGDSLDEVKGLSVRCHSMLVPDIKSSGKPSTVLKRSDSISNGRCHGSSNSMTEVEKKRLSLTLGKEILNKVSQKKSSRSPVAPRETLGAIAAASAKKKNIPQTLSTINTSPRTCYSLETSLDEDTSKSRDRSDFLLVLTPNGDSPVSRKKVENVLEEWAKKPPLLALSVPNTQIKNTSGSELDSTTESSENSVKTVVQREDKADVVPRKVEFFENIKREKETNEQSLVHFAGMKKRKSKLSSSQSFADLKELFGESESARYVSSPFHPSEPGSCIHVKSSESETSDKGKRGSTSISPDVPSGRLSSDSHSHDLEHHRPRSVSPCRVSTSTCSLESLRYRSISPDPEHYWRAYLQLVKHGAVKKLRAKFESLEELSGERVKFALTPKRFQSDPELTRNLLKRVSDEKKTLKRVEVPDVAWLRRKYEPIRRRSKRRLTRSPIPRIPLRLEDLTMPHINVISKTAELKDNAMSRSSSSNSLAIKAETEELEASRPVGRLREKFEKMETNKPSILGEMFTSAPDVYELRDISPYLTGHWVAHKYPSRRDNARSLSLPPDLESSSNRKSQTVKTHSGRTTLPRDEKSKGLRPVSASPVRSRTPTSILKQRQTDPFANQPFDPSKHRPKYRYQPPPTPPPPAPLIRRATRPWWPPLPTYIAKPTVTFEEYSNAPPPPPPKSQHCRSDYQESPRRYVEGEVTIHYRSPVRTEAKEILSEEELARRSAENMRRVYQEERRRKYLQELHDIDSRRHTDNFIPSQKSPIPLNRYDDFVDDLSYRSRSQEQTPEPRLVARALYNFVGQTSRELSFRRGDIILIRRQIDKNWYEGEHNAMVGLFPLNHVEILPYDGARTTPKKPYEGQARAKFNFIAQTNLELSLAKGELVVLTRRVDENWYEGRIGNKKGIFPVSYVEVIMEPGQHRPETPVSSKPVASPAAHSMLSNGTASGKMSMGPHHYTPSIPVKTNTTEPQYISLPRIGVTERNKLHVAPVNETLHIDTHSDTIPYRALYNYRPQNEDELELKEGDTVYVIEKCDDGWFVGSSQRTGYFGTFPGNYVERL